MRLLQNMTTIAECTAPENSVPNRVIKIAVIGGSGVGKTGKNSLIKSSPESTKERDTRSIL